MKKGLLSGLILIILFSSASYSNELTDDYFDISCNYYSSNNIAKAIEYIDLILMLDSENKQAKALRDKILPPSLDISQTQEKTIKILNNTNNPEEVTIIAPLKVDTNSVKYDANYYLTKGQEFYQKRDFDSAIQYFYKVINLDKNNCVAYNNLGMSYWFKGNIDAAIKNFKLANKKNKLYTQPLVNLANLYLQTGKSKKALKQYNSAIKINPDDYLAYYYLGDYYRKINNYPMAIKSYQEVIKIDKKFPQVYLKLAMSFFEIEEFEYCIFTLKQYQELCPESDYAYLLMAKSALNLGKYDLAKNYISAALIINDCDEYRLEQAKIFYNLGDYKLSQKTIEKLLQTNESAELFNYLGLCFYKQKNVDAAILNFKKAIDIDGLRPIYYYNLAQCYKSLLDKKNYVKYINTATQINPVNYQDFIDLSYIFFDNSNIAYAINTLNDGIKRYPNVKSLYLSKLRIYEVTGDNADYKLMKELIEKRFNNYEECKKEKTQK